MVDWEMDAEGNTKAYTPRKGTGKVICSTVEPTLNIIYLVLKQCHLTPLHPSWMYK